MREEIENQKKIIKRLKSINESLKDLLILELAKANFNNNQIKRVIGKISNNRLRRIVAVLNKIKGDKKSNEK